MKNTIAFFEIPAVDFSRAVRFYEALLGVKLSVAEHPGEKIACLPDGSGAVSWAEGFEPSPGGPLLYLRVDDVDAAMGCVAGFGGHITRPKTKIEVDGMGYFSTFIDSEGNRLGLYSAR